MQSIHKYQIFYPSEQLPYCAVFLRGEKRLPHSDMGAIGMSVVVAFIVFEGTATIFYTLYSYSFYPYNADVIFHYFINYFIKKASVLISFCAGRILFRAVSLFF